MGAKAKIGGASLILIILGSLYFLYINGTFAGLMSTPISSIVSNPSSYVGKQITITGELVDGNVGGWYALSSPMGFVEVKVNKTSPYVEYYYGYNYTMTGIFEETQGCSIMGVVSLGKCPSIYNNSYGVDVASNVEVYYLNVTSVKPA